MTTYKYDYPIHSLANLFPDLSEEEFKKLKDDIRMHGQQEPIMLSADGTVLLDGRNRMRACKELGIQPRVERLALNGRTTEADYIWSKNVLRRHLTDDQRAALALKWSDTEREAAKERQRLHGGTAPGKPKPNTSGESTKSVHTRKAIAQKAQVSEHKVRQAETVAKHAPELLPKVESGDVKLKDAVESVSPKQIARTHSKLKQANKLISKLEETIRSMAPPARCTIILKLRHMLDKIETEPSLDKLRNSKPADERNATP